MNAGSAAADRVDRTTWMVAGTVTLGAIMTSIDTTVVNVALDGLTREFDASVASVQWVATGYLLALAMVMPLSGWATDRFGGKRVWAVSIALFLAGSMLAGAAWSLGSLIAFRVLQGLGGGMIVPVGMTLVTRAAGPGRVGRVMGVLGLQQLLGPVLGPVIGGLLVDSAGWRWIFYVNVPVGVAALAAAARFLPADAPQPCDRLDLRGFLLLSPGIAALVLGLAALSEESRGLVTWTAVAPLLLGAALVAAFVVHARHVPNPLLDVRLFRGRAFSAGVATTFCTGMALFGALFLLPLYFQRVRGLAALDAGLLLAPQGIGAAIMMPLAGRLTDRLGPGRVVLCGLGRRRAARRGARASDPGIRGCGPGAGGLRAGGRRGLLADVLVGAGVLRDRVHPGRVPATAPGAGGRSRAQRAQATRAGHSSGRGDGEAPRRAADRRTVKIVPTHDAHADAAAGPLRVLVAVREGLLQASLSFLLTGPRSDDGGAAAGHHRRMLDSLTRIRARSGLVPLLAGVLALQACGGSDAPGAPVPPSNASATVQEQFNDVIRRVSPQVVQIETGSGLGSGVVYDRQGDIVTNAHVVGNAQRFLVTLHGGERHQATLVGTDPGNDLAVIRLSGATPTAATFADSAGVQSGDIGFAIGSDTVRIVADDLIGGRA